MWRSSHRWNLESASKSLFLVHDMVLPGEESDAKKRSIEIWGKCRRWKRSRLTWLWRFYRDFCHPYMGGLSHCEVCKIWNRLIFFGLFFFLASIWHLSRSCLFSVQLCAKINSSSPFELLADIFVSNQVSLNSRACRCEWIVYWHYHHVVYKAATLIYI